MATKRLSNLKNEVVMEDQRCIWERTDDGCHWCGLTNSSLVCGHCRQFKTLDQERKELHNVTRPGIW